MGTPLENSPIFPTHVLKIRPSHVAGGVQQLSHRPPAERDRGLAGDRGQIGKDHGKDEGW